MYNFDIGREIRVVTYLAALLLPPAPAFGFPASIGVMSVSSNTEPPSWAGNDLCAHVTQRARQGEWTRNKWTRLVGQSLNIGGGGIPDDYKLEFKSLATNRNPAGH